MSDFVLCCCLFLFVVPVELLRMVSGSISAVMTWILLFGCFHVSFVKWVIITKFHTSFLAVCILYILCFALRLYDFLRVWFSSWFMYFVAHAYARVMPRMLLISSALNSSVNMLNILFLNVDISFIIHCWPLCRDLLYPWCPLFCHILVY
jgi:hypothetical protein